MKNIHIKDEQKRIAHELYKNAGFIEELEREIDNHVLSFTHTKMSYTEGESLKGIIKEKQRKLIRAKKQQQDLQQKHDSLN